MMILPAAVMMVVSGCSPSQRLERLVARHPELTIPDTLRLTDTIITPGTFADTMILFKDLADTVVITQDDLIMQVFSKRDTLYLRGECKPDTICRTIEIPVEKIKLVKPGRADALIRKIPWIVTGIIVLAGLLIWDRYRSKERH